MNETNQQTHLTEITFAELALEQSLQEGLKQAGFTHCTPIQAQTLPLTLQKQDIAGQAQTGTGKTIAFLLACCHQLLQNKPEEKKPRALILAPTRELAIQIYKDAQLIAGDSGLNFALVYGGTEYEKQIDDIKNNCDIVIGTPGRIIDLFKQKLLPLSAIEVFVLDEADRMFDLGFIKDIRYLAHQMPAAEKRLNLLFSATLSFRVMELAYEHMNDPTEVTVESQQVIAEKIQEYGYYPAQEEKPILLVNLLKNEETQKVIVFVNTKHAADYVSRTLSSNDINHGVLSGDVPQKKREALLQNFIHKDCNVLVATDVAARGIHVNNVSHVINYDIPQDADDYVHRIGRTARAGNSGIAISLICDKYAYSMLDIEELIGHTIQKKTLDESLLKTIQPPSAAKEKTKTKANKPNQRTSQKPTQRPNQTDSLIISNYMQTLQQRYAQNDLKQPESRFSHRFGETPLIG